MADNMDLGKLYVHLKADVTSFMASMTVVKRGITSVTGHMHSLSNAIKMKVILPLTILSGVSVKAFASFDDAMTKSLAIMSDVSPKMQDHMKRTALALSRDGVQSAKELADSYFFLASAGLTAAQSVAALPAVMSFATAGAFDMSLATDLATDAQTALGMSCKDSTQNMENLVRITDILVGANTIANASTQQFAEALMADAGPSAKQMGISLEETVAVLGAYANQGKKGAAGGNLFGRMLRLTLKSVRENATEWQRLGISVYDAYGNILPMGTMISNISRAFEGLSPKQKVARLEMLGFAALAQKSILPLLGLGDVITEYTARLKDMEGITKRTADKQLKSFSSQMRILWNNIKDVAIAIGARLAPSLEQMGMWFRENQAVIKDWAIYFADRIVFVGEIIGGFFTEFQGGFWNGFIVLKEAIISMMEATGKAAIDIALRTGKGVLEGFKAGIMGGGTREDWDEAEKIYEEREGHKPPKRAWNRRTSEGFETLGTYKRFYEEETPIGVVQDEGVEKIVKELQRNKVLDNVFDGMGEAVKGYYDDALKEISGSSPQMKATIDQAFASLKAKDLARETERDLDTSMEEGGKGTRGLNNDMEDLLDTMTEIQEVSKQGLFEAGSAFVDYSALAGSTKLAPQKEKMLSESEFSSSYGYRESARTGTQGDPYKAAYTELMQQSAETNLILRRIERKGGLG